MKTLVPFAPALLVGLLMTFSPRVAFAHIDGPDPRVTGAPGDEPRACAACHFGSELNSGTGNVVIVLPNGNSYTPGTKQHIKVNVSDAAQRRWGFQLTARRASDLSSAQAGDFNPTDAFTQSDGAVPLPSAAPGANRDMVDGKVALHHEPQACQNALPTLQHFPANNNPNVGVARRSEQPVLVKKEPVSLRAEFSKKR